MSPFDTEFEAFPAVPVPVADAFRTGVVATTDGLAEVVLTWPVPVESVAVLAPPACSDPIELLTSFPPSPTIDAGVEDVTVPSGVTAEATGAVANELA
jgi:hypothetical protein